MKPRILYSLTAVAVVIAAAYLLATRVTPSSDVEAASNHAPPSDPSSESIEVQIGDDSAPLEQAEGGSEAERSEPKKIRSPLDLPNPLYEEYKSIRKFYTLKYLQLEMNNAEFEIIGPDMYRVTIPAIYDQGGRELEQELMHELSQNFSTQNVNVLLRGVKDLMGARFGSNSFGKSPRVMEFDFTSYSSEGVIEITVHRNNITRKINSHIEELDLFIKPFAQTIESGA